MSLELEEKMEIEEKIEILVSFIEEAQYDDSFETDERPDGLRADNLNPDKYLSDAGSLKALKFTQSEFELAKKDIEEIEFSWNWMREVYDVNPNGSYSSFEEIMYNDGENSFEGE